MRGHSKMESPQNWLISDPTPPMSPFVTNLPHTPLSTCHWGNSDEYGEFKY